MNARVKKSLKTILGLGVGFLIGVVLMLSLISTCVFAGDPLNNDKDFLMGDPDGDMIKNWEEFLIGTDPFNSDSDNDGLPDWWELEYSQWVNDKANAQLDPTDASDAHLDFDYEPYSDASGYNIGECDAEFTAVRTLLGGKLITWPSNPTIKFTDPVFDETGPHYDNYEEFYRPYTNLKDLVTIKYMHTNPIYSDTDGDRILDPDDQEPLGYPNCGTSPGAVDEMESKIDDQKTELEGILKEKPGVSIIFENEPNEPNEPMDELLNEQNHLDFQIDITNSMSKSNVKEIKNLIIPDADNDGI